MRVRAIAWLLVFTFVAQVTLAQTAAPAPVPAGKPAGGQEVAVGGTKGPVGAPTGAPAISPFIGEAAVGVSMLIAYGPQIIALAATVATLAAAVSYITHTTKDSVNLVTSIGDKMQNMLQILLGPLTVSTGASKEGVDALSSHLLQVTKFVTNSVSAPVSQVNDDLNKAVSMSRDVEDLAARGKDMAFTVKSMADQNRKDLDRIVMGEEVQVFRDGAKKVSEAMSQRADGTAGVFNQTLERAKTATRSLTALQQRIDGALASSGKPAEDVSLFDIGVSGSEVNKKLIEARKEMVSSHNILAAADKGSAGMHTQIMELLTGVKGDLERFAAAKGITPAQIEQAKKDMEKQNAAVVKGPLGSQEKSSGKLTEDIRGMIDKIATLNRNLGPANAPGRQTAVGAGGQRGNSDIDQLYQRRVTAYCQFIQQINDDPGNSAVVEQARTRFEHADQAYRDAMTRSPGAQKNPKVEPSRTVNPKVEPSRTRQNPKVEPSVEPSVEPAVEPSVEPGVRPAVEPSVEPGVRPAVEPGVEPGIRPAVEPSVEPGVRPAVEPRPAPAPQSGAR